MDSLVLIFNNSSFCHQKTTSELFRLGLYQPETGAVACTQARYNFFSRGAQFHLQKLSLAVVYRNQYIFGFPSEIWGSCRRILESPGLLAHLISSPVIISILPRFWTSSSHLAASQIFFPDNHIILFIYPETIKHDIQVPGSIIQIKPVLKFLMTIKPCKHIFNPFMPAAP